MWKDIIRHVKAIEVSIQHNKDYVHRSDAVNLASVSGDISNIASHSQLLDLGIDGSSKIPNQLSLPSLRGLVRLSADINKVLSEGLTQEQRDISMLRNAIQTSCDQVTRNAKYLQSYHNHLDMEVNSTSKESNLIDVDDFPTHVNDWNQLPAAEDDEHGQLIQQNSPHLRYLDRKRKIDLFRRKLIHRFEEHYECLQTIIDAKVFSYNTIQRILDTYTYLLVNEAHSCGVSNALYRANMCTKQPYQSLLQNKFLDTAEISALMETLKTGWSKLCSKDDRIFSERSLSIKYSFNERLTDNWLTNLKVGAGGTLFLWAISECFNNEKLGHYIWNDPTFTIFMTIGDLLLLLWMWGVSMHVWRSYDIDFVRLLSLHSTEFDNISYPERIVYSSAADMTLIFLAVFIVFNKALRGVLNLDGNLVLAHSLPILMAFYFIYRILSPWYKRKIWLKMLLEVLAAPSYPVGFRDGYIGDILTSLVRVLVSMSYSITYLLVVAINLFSFDVSFEASSTNRWQTKSPFFRHFLIPVLSLLPLWIRLMQCLRRAVESGHRWPHFGNAAKYASALSVISFGLFHNELHRSPIWISSFVFATLFQFTWDITMDWGVVVWKSSKYATPSIHFLGLSVRENRLFGSIWYYISFMICNLFLRFAWILTLLPPTIAGSQGSIGELVLYHLGPLIAAFEVLRRMVWGFYRLEYEQIEVHGISDVISEKEDLLTSAASLSDSAGKNLANDYDWTGWIPGLLEYLQYVRIFGLKPTSTLQQRGRFIEGILFASTVLSFVLFAAFSATL